MIIQLNNEGWFAQFERHFDCGWLSAFPEESERLWMGGREMQKLESVRDIKTKNNFGRFLRAFHLFDAMVSGMGHEATKKDARIVGGAVRGYLGIERNGYHSFVKDTFRHFCARKTQITLALEKMNFSIQNVDFVFLIMNEVKEQKEQKEYSDISDDDANLFKPVLFELFGNVQELVIDADEYAFNLERLSQFAFPSALKRMRITGKWLKDGFTAAMEQIFNERDWKVETFDERGLLSLVR